MTSRDLTTVLLTLLLASPAAHPATFKITASGPFEVADPLGLLPFAVPAHGGTLHLTFSFDDGVGVTSTSPSRASYTDGISPLQLTIDGAIYTLVGDTREIRVTNDCACVTPGLQTGQPYEDSWQISQRFLRSKEGLIEGITLALFSASFGSPGGPLGTTALTAPPALGDWQTGAIFYSIGEADPALFPAGRFALVRGSVSSLAVTPVPGPGALWLLGTALAVLGRSARPASPAGRGQVQAGTGGRPIWSNRPQYRGSGCASAQTPAFGRQPATLQTPRGVAGEPSQRRRTADESRDEDDEVHQPARLRAAAPEVQLALSGGEALDHPLVTCCHALIQHVIRWSSRARSRR